MQECEIWQNVKGSKIARSLLQTGKEPVYHSIGLLAAWAIAWAAFFMAQRKLGQLIKQGQESGEIAGRDSGRPISQTGGLTYPKTFDEIGIEKDQAHRFKAIATSQRHNVTT